LNLYFTPGNCRKSALLVIRGYNGKHKVIKKTFVPNDIFYITSICHLNVHYLALLKPTLSSDKLVVVVFLIDGYDG